MASRVGNGRIRYRSDRVLARRTCHGPREPVQGVVSTLWGFTPCTTWHLVWAAHDEPGCHWFAAPLWICGWHRRDMLAHSKSMADVPAAHCKGGYQLLAGLLVSTRCLETLL